MPSFEADAKLISVSPGGFVTKNVDVMRVDLYEIDALNVPMISRGVVLPFAKTLECSCVCSAGREGNVVYTSLHMMLMEAPVSIIAIYRDSNCRLFGLRRPFNCRQSWSHCPG